MSWALSLHLGALAGGGTPNSADCQEWFRCSHILIIGLGMNPLTNSTGVYTHATQRPIHSTFTEFSGLDLVEYPKIKKS